MDIELTNNAVSKLIMKLISSDPKMINKMFTRMKLGSALTLYNGAWIRPDALTNNHYILSGSTQQISELLVDIIN